MKELPVLAEAIRQGTRLHAFRSGGGLRVVCCYADIDGESKDESGYGEHPCIYDALLHAEEDRKVGGRRYDEVYGKIYDHYLTGDSHPAGGLDAWLLRGRSFDIVFQNGEFVFKSKYSKYRLDHEDVKRRLDLCRESQKDAEAIIVRWSQDDYEFEATQDRLSNGYSVRCVASPGKGDAFMYHDATATFSDPTLHGLIQKLDQEFSDYERWR